MDVCACPTPDPVCLVICPDPFIEWLHGALPWALAVFILGFSIVLAYRFLRYAWSVFAPMIRRTP